MSVVDYLKKIKAEKVERAIQHDVLLDEWNNDREYIIQNIKDSLKNNSPQDANSLIKYFYSVAKEDTEFSELTKLTNILIEKEKDYKQALVKYESLSVDNFEERRELCTQILLYDPSNQQVMDDLVKCEEHLGIRPILSSDLRLGRIQDSLKADYCSDSLVKLPICGEVILKVHTHGISIQSSACVFRIHYTQISNMKYDSKFDVKSFLKAAGSAALLGIGIYGCVSGILSLGNLSSCLNILKSNRNDWCFIHELGLDCSKEIAGCDKLISSTSNSIMAKGGVALGSAGLALKGVEGVTNTKVFHHFLIVEFFDVKTKLKNVIAFACDGKENINKFIDRYNAEIELTKRTNRTPKSEINYLGMFLGKMGKIIKIICIIFLILIGLIVLLLVWSPSTDKSSAVDQSITTEAQSALATDSELWEGNNSSTCAIHNSDTTLTVTGTKSSDASLEITGITINECKTVDIAFDNQTPKSVKCSLNQGKIKIESDRRMIKNMRGSANMKVTLPLDNGDGKIIHYSLAGFSKACEWTK